MRKMIYYKVEHTPHLLAVHADAIFAGHLQNYPQDSPAEPHGQFCVQTYKLMDYRGRIVSPLYPTKRNHLECGYYEEEFFP